MARELISEAAIRVRYADTDKMGYVYYANYLVYFEVGRTEFIRNVWKPYSEIEEMGYILPVLASGVEYKSSAYYDDLLKVRTSLKKFTGVKMRFEYQVCRGETLIATGFTEHCFTNPEGKPTRIPLEMREKLKNIMSC